MNKKIIVAICFGLCVLLFGCGQVQVRPPSSSVLSGANHGQKITPQQAEVMIKEYFNKTLLDPYSAVYDMPKTVSKHWMIDKNGSYYFGYVASVSVNAKNRMGGYTGSKEYVIVFYGGVILKVCEVGKYDVYPDPYVFPTNLIQENYHAENKASESVKNQAAPESVVAHQAKSVEPPSKEAVEKLCNSMGNYAGRVYKNRESVSAAEQQRRVIEKTSDKPATRALMLYSIDKAFSSESEERATGSTQSRCLQVASELIVKQVKKLPIDPISD